VSLEELDEHDAETEKYLPRWRFLQRQAVWIAWKYATPAKFGDKP
jgi:hypothetical protein